MPSEGVAQERTTELTPTQRTLVESLQAFVREESRNESDPKKREKEELQPLQIVFLFALALDITLLYVTLLGVFPNIPENRGVVFFLQRVLPTLGGTLAVSYFKRLRAWLFEVSQNRRVGTAFLALLALLVAATAPVYSVYVRLDPPSSRITFVRLDPAKPEIKPLEEKPAQTDKTGDFLLVDAPRSYDLMVRDGSNPSFTYHIDTFHTLKGTLVRVLWSFFPRHFVNEHFSPLSVPAAYKVAIHYNRDQTGQLYIYDGRDVRLNQWDEQNKYNYELDPVTSAAPVGACPSLRGCWHKQIETDEDVVVLPRGDYTFTKANKGCILQAAWKISGSGQHKLIYKEPDVRALTQECR